LVRRNLPAPGSTSLPAVRSINHKHDMLPDFLIFDSQRFTTGDTEATVCGGWFDVDWLPKEDLAWAGDEDSVPPLAEY